ncbi:type I DNA topoisomerase [Saprospiraceae bacterium]|nr:type I DNA topoisomerase [Saprospiraceae bacterium]
MAKKLLIVESPAKAKTIEKYLGKDFTVKSSYGHIRDLDKGKNGINVEDRFTPNYVVSPEKIKVVAELKSAAKKVDEVWLATDEDREGEAISWHLCEELNLDVKTTPRIVFREITKPAIQKAVLEPRLVDMDLVNAQQARRILDRIVGFELSGVLWRKVKNKLSAGRVQSVTVKLISDREREIQKFTTEPYYRVTADFNVKNAAGQMVKLQAELSEKIAVGDDAKAFLEKCNGVDYKINDIVKKPLKRKPSAPFITSTLQQDASRKLGFGVSRTMSVAQRLYEQGFISYMRTDSTSLSQTAQNAITAIIVNNYGEEFSEPRKFKSKDSNAQEAHEAIRPTYMDRRSLGSDDDQKRLYELIWKRTIASQMSPAELEKTTVTIGISSVADKTLRAVGEVLKFEGFLKVYMESKDDDEEESEAKGILPPLSVAQMLDLDEMLATEKFTRGPARYTEASLVKKLEELGIGRPSTYAPTISKIMDQGRGYVTKESRDGIERVYDLYRLKSNNVDLMKKTEITGATSNRLYASDIGLVVTDFLTSHFEDVMSFNFTAEVEDQLDHISDGGKDWQNWIMSFYEPFHAKVEDTIENAERAKGKRELGIDEATGFTILVQMSRYGPAAQIGTREEVGEEGKPRFSSLQPGQSMETITLEEVLELFKFPKTLGNFEGVEVTINQGRFGPYIKYDDKYVNIPKSEDPMGLDIEKAIEYVKIKLEEDKPVTTYQGEDVTKGKGRFGPFLKYKSMFINIPDNIPVIIIHSSNSYVIPRRS